VVSRWAGSDDVEEFLQSRLAWLEEKVAWARAWAARPSLLGLGRPGVVWRDAEPFAVRWSPSQASTARLRDGVLQVGGPPADAARAIERWYRREARSAISGMVEREARRLECDVRGISIRDPSTRWGSCSTSGALSFSWRLVLVPAEVALSVVDHELCHLRVPSHSKRFWRELDRARPEWRTEDRWLHEFGHELHAYDPATALTRSVTPAVGEVSGVARG
jgi:predicted metal-dependent hydrolase